MPLSEKLFFPGKQMLLLQSKLHYSIKRSVYFLWKNYFVFISILFFIVFCPAFNFKRTQYNLWELLCVTFMKCWILLPSLSVYLYFCQNKRVCNTPLGFESTGVCNTVISHFWFNILLLRYCVITLLCYLFWKFH